MARGVRSGATILSPNLQPQSVASYDPITRRNTILVASIVPTISLADSATGSFYAADRYYVHAGLLSGTTVDPPWVGTTGSGTYNTWSSPNFYSRVSWNAGAAPRFAWYAGVGGTAPSHAPKNVAVSSFILEFRAAFPNANDYGTNGRGVGFSSDTGASDFSAAFHNFFVGRSATQWQLGSSDASTMSVSASGTADTSMHNFKVVWTSADITLYVDGASTIVKTTNRPAQPLRVHVRGTVASYEVNLVDFLARWE